MCTLHKDVFTFRTISRYFLLRMRNVLDKMRRESQSIYFISKSFFSENCAIYEIMSKNMVDPEGPQMTSQYGAYALNSG